LRGGLTIQKLEMTWFSGFGQIFHTCFSIDRKMSGKQFKNKSIKKPVFLYKKNSDHWDHLPENVFLNRNNKEKSIHKWADYRRYAKKRYPWLNHEDNFDYYIQKKHRKSYGISHKPGYTSVNNFKNWGQARKYDFMHKKFKSERRKGIYKNHELARQRRAQLADWRKSGSKGTKPVYKNKPF